MLKLITLALLLLLQGTLNAQTFSSGDKAVQLLELYTSEGCSSCPPAENWLRSFKTDNRLWAEIIPVAFHVDYWNYLGWKDRYAFAANSRRQYAYKKTGNITSVYTPGFVVNGEEWRGWYHQRSLPDTIDSEGVLSLELSGQTLTAHYEPVFEEAEKSGQPLILNVALLGFDIKTDIKAGENRGKMLQHDFVVLNHQSVKSNSKRWEMEIPKDIAPMPGALAAWVTGKDKIVLQATGGWLAH